MPLINNQRELWAKPMRALALAVLLPALCLLSAQAFAAQPGTYPWAYTSLGCRRQVTLPPDPSKSRTNMPVFVDLKQVGYLDLTTIKVDEVSGSTPKPCPAAAYAQPSGRDPRAFWIATGSTAAGQTRTFLFYYNKRSTPTSYAYNWDRPGSTFGSSSTTAIGNSFKKFYYTLAGDRVELLRGARNLRGGTSPQAGAFYEQNPGNDEFFRFKDLSSSFSPLNGIRMNYAFCGDAFTDAVFFNVSGKEQYYDSIKFDRNGPTTAMSAHYKISDQTPHQAEVSHRLFKGLPLMEFSVTATPNSGAQLEFARDLFASRQFYWKSSFSPSRMISDIAGDTAISSESDVKTWQILYSGNGQAIGLFTFKPGLKRQLFSTRAIQDYYELSSDACSVYEYYAIGNRSEILTLFQTMKRGYPVGTEQQASFDIIQPEENYRFFTGETVSIVVAGPKIGSDLALTVKYPGGGSARFTPTGSSGTYKTFNLGTIGVGAKFGQWTLTATSGGLSRTHKIDVYNPDHPRVLFTSSELNAIRRRWQTDSRYYTHIQSRLEDRAAGAYSGGPVPKTITVSPRDYGRNLGIYAAVLLMNPALSQYRQRMWQDFDTIINWKNWDHFGNNCMPFIMDDVVRGEMLQVLAIVYDWHYNDLSIANRRRYADLLAQHADSILANDYAGVYPYRWFNYNWATNNRHMIQNAAVAGVDRLLNAEIPAARHAKWKSRLDTNFAIAAKTLYHDGSSNSGASYNSLLMVSLFYWTETRRLNGDSAVYAKIPWLDQAPYYQLYGVMPGRVGNFGGMIPFGNCDPAPYSSLEMINGLIGLRKGSTISQWIAETCSYGRVETYEPFWLDYSRPATDPASLPNWHYFSDRGIFVFRSSWNNEAMYFASKCGPMWGGHEHPDSGTFTIQRNGFPYIDTPHYIFGYKLRDENILTANGMTVQGRSNGDYYATIVDPQYWAKTVRALGSPAYFNVLTDPKNAYEDGSALTAYSREFVGFGDLVILKDTIAASKASTFDLTLHGFKVDVQTNPGEAYDPNQYPYDQIFKNMGANLYRLYPNMSAAPGEFLTIQDLSKTAWSTNIEAWRSIPEKKTGYIAPGGSRASNSSKTTYSRGYQMRRTASGVSSASSLQLFQFRGDSFTSRKWNTSVADCGLLFYAASDPSDVLIKVVWPKGGVLNASEGLTVHGQMAMRNYENMDYGGRDLTYLRDDSAKGEHADLVKAGSPVTVVARFAGGNNDAYIICDKAVNITLYHPAAVAKATFNGKPVSVTTQGNYKTFSLPAAPLGGKLVTA